MKLIILDRDGVINQDSDAFVKNPDEWIALPGSLQAIARLTPEQYHVLREAASALRSIPFSYIEACFACGAKPGVMDRSTFGSPAKYTFCFGENEEE